jgi:BASS family bile acid:Na+ symporter
MEIGSIAGLLPLFLLMFIIGMELTPADFARVFEAPRAVVGGTLGQWILLPLMTWFVVRAFDLEPAFGAGAILVAASPGAGASNVLAALGRGNIALSVTLTATASVFAAVTLPTLAAAGMKLFLDDATPVEVPVDRLIVQLLLTLVVPIGLGMLLRTREPERAAAWAPVLQQITLVAIVAVVVWTIANAPEEQVDFEGGARSFVAAGVWTVLAGGIGVTLARLLKLSAADRFTFGIEFAARNIGVAAIVAMSGLDRIDLTFFSGVYATVGYPLLVSAVIWRRRRGTAR